MASVASNKCPLCGKAVADKFKPFCSARCATLDLGQWLGEGYRIANDDQPEHRSQDPESDEESD